MNPAVDYHMHTPLCGHAVGQPEAYVQHALKIGLKEMGFSDHAPLVTHRDPGITMGHDQLPEYYRMIETVQKDFAGQINIKIGIEADFIPGYEAETKKILSDYPYDYVIGSVHYIKEWGFDNPSEQQKWNDADIDEVYRDYYDLLRQSAECQMFNIIGHADLVKKFGHRPASVMEDEIRATAEVFQKCGVAVEINTAGLRKPVKEIYPALDILKIYCEANIPLTFGSDAHKPEEVGADYEQALKLAQAAGYKEYVTFKQREIEKVIKL